ncbi:MAG: hypothetical protein E7298_02855 [Lachnospiraceae bacterium]|nr:hypothetical protein [Lachnospiraceae bacterium]
MTENKFDYYYGAEGDQFSFIRIPKLMLLDPKFKDLSLGAKMLYGLLLDRMNNSIKHGWIDENNHVYIRYKIKDIQSALNLSENTATKYLMELEKIGLVEKVKVGMGQGNVLYVKNFISPDLRDKAFITTKNCGNGEADYYSKKLGSPKLPSKPPEKGAIEASKINITAEIGGNGAADFGGNGTAEIGGNETADFKGQNKKENNNKYINKTQSNPSVDMFFNIYKRRAARVIDKDRIDEIDDSMIYRTGLREQTEYEALCNDNPESEDLIDEIIETMVEMMLCTNPRQQISGNEYSSELVKQRIMRTYRKHVEYMMDCLSKNTTKVSNIKGYLKATIFNAQSTIDSYYRAEVNHNEYGRETKKSNTYNGYTFEELESLVMCN